MNDLNNLTDKDIRNLLKRRLIEQDADDVLTQKLIDMEAKLVFSDEAQIVPSTQKEKELFAKLNGGQTSFWNWLLPGCALLAILSIIIFMKGPEYRSIPLLKENVTLLPPVNNPSPQQKMNGIMLADSTFFTEQLIPTVTSKPDTISADSVRKEIPEKWKAEDAGIKVDYKAGKHKPKFVDPYENIPVPGKYEMELTKKMKEKMVKQLLKKDKEFWSLVPMSTDNINGEVVSLNAFYIATAEVTNGQYRTFLNDLLMQGKIDEYLKAAPDTSKWISEGRALFYKLQPDSTKWPQPAAAYYEPLRKNYYWHPAYDSYPVVNVSREAAKMYCDWLTNAVNEKIKQDNSESKWNDLFINDLRIPQDVEWIMAARAGHSTADYPWPGQFLGKTIGPQNQHGCYLANFCIRDYKSEIACPNNKFPGAYNSAATVSHDYVFMTPVTSYNPNDYNLFCLAGNAAEMVWISKTGKAGTKGGSWSSDAEHIKINAEDEYAGVTEGSIYIGFRPVFTARLKK
jgi:formylglycine-generating enzyme required for sulfatase activity